MKKIAFILHGKIKHRHSLISRIENVFSGSFELSFSTTTYPKHSEELALTAVINGATHIICVGGDGSLNEVVNGVMSAKRNSAGTGVSYDSLRVGLLPSGTGNDFSKTMKVVNDIGRLRQLIEDDSCRSIDLGLAEFIDPKGQKASQYFINITDVGMGGVVVEKIAKSSKFLGANLTYQKSIIGTLLTYKNRPVKAVIDDKKLK